MKRSFALFVSVLLALTVLIPGASAHPDHPVTDDPNEEHEDTLQGPISQGDSLEAADSTSFDFVSDGPSGKTIKNVSLAGRGDRLAADATTDVWAYGKYSYTGTFNSPCGGTADDAGVHIWDTHNKNKPEFVTVIPSPVGSRSNDVRVDGMNSGDVLVHTNESCAGGPGGFEIYNVDDPSDPIHLAHVQTDDVNLLLRDGLGFTDFGTHNLFLFTQGEADYVAVTVESELGNFQIWDITDPSNPVRVGFWGAEQLALPDVDDWVNLDDFDVILEADAYLFGGFGASQNRFLHDVTITADGNTAYLANWDAGLVMLDISDVTDPSLISVAIDPTSEDGEVNSHSVWPSEDGNVVIEGEEDFSPFTSVFSITDGPNAGDYPASEGAITTPIVSLPGGEMAGATTYVGLACGSITDGGGIALIQRGVCAFSLKAQNALDAGYTGIVVFNDEARGDALVSMGGTAVDIPGVFVGHSTGLNIAGVASAADLVLDGPGAGVFAAAIPDGWSGMRIWDYSDPSNPILASTFNTVCSANPIDPSCDPAGTYSSHNVIVETNDDGVVKAYISWYFDGVIILDITDPYNPVEIGRFTDDTQAFIDQNGGAQDVWGIYKIADEPWLYAADRNGGLYILKEKGSGSGK